MDTTVRATCPQCQTVLRIPSQWVGQAVKCKKCGSVVRSKPRGDGITETSHLDNTPITETTGTGPTPARSTSTAGRPKKATGCSR